MDAFHAEMIAVVRGLSIAREMGMAHVSLETNSLMVKQAAMTGGLIKEFKDLDMFEFPLFYFVQDLVIG